jgi:F0F1-type ATP synthase epsilon subunit
MDHNDNSSKLTVIARAPFHVYYQGPAKYVSATNKVGKFDILPGHADFFSVMVPGEVTIETEDNSIKFDVSNGFLGVRDGYVLIFVNM